jgi:hypothetical protein
MSDLNFWDFFEIVVIGTALACIWYWLAMLVRVRMVSTSEGWKWWLSRIVPQGVVIALALKVLQLLPT